MINFDLTIPAALYWLSILLIGWTYVGYMIFLKLFTMKRTRSVNKENITPPVTLVVTAHNEAKRIREKIENCLAINYPPNLLEIIIVSDASEDGTDDIIRSFTDRGVQLFRINERKGKHFGQGRGIRQASSEIVVLSDATTFLNPDAVTKIVRCFADETVGVVSGEDVIEKKENGTSGEGAYVRYEMKLRTLEADSGSLIGASGCFFAIRKGLAEDWIDDLSSDFYMPIIAHMKGYRTIIEPEAIGHYQVLGDSGKEFRRKVRTVLHGLEVLFEFKEIMNPFRYGFFSLQIISHKLMRWLVPFCLLIIIVTNALLFNEAIFYQFSLFSQAAFYLLVLLAYLIPSLQKITVFRLPFFFCMVNISIAAAWLQFVRGEKQVVWAATKR